MTYLGEDSVSMGKLTHLYLDHMSLQDLSDQAFSQARLLSHVDLGYNQLRYLEPLSGPTKLGILNLTGTVLHSHYKVEMGGFDMKSFQGSNTLAKNVTRKYSLKYKSAL